jgi:hypothetical protein
VHKNSDQDSEAGSVAIRNLPPRDNAAPLADQPEGRHRQPEKKLTEQKAP